MNGKTAKLLRRWARYNENCPAKERQTRLSYRQLKAAYTRIPGWKRVHLKHHIRSYLRRAGFLAYARRAMGAAGFEESP